MLEDTSVYSQLVLVKSCVASVEYREWAEEIVGALVLVGAADELCVELLVSFQADTSMLLVILLQVQTSSLTVTLVTVLTVTLYGAIWKQ